MKIARIAFALLILIAVGMQFAAATQHPAFDPGNFFSYFTNLSNLFAAVMLLIAVRTPAPSRALDVARGAATLCMAMVGIIFSLLLAGIESDIIPWVNFIVHYLMPVVIVLDWIVNPPDHPVGYRDALLWLVIPVAYVVYSLVRGAVTHWYPYPFLNIERLGLEAFLRSLAVMFGGTVILAAAVAAIGNYRRARGPRAMQPRR